MFSSLCVFKYILNYHSVFDRSFFSVSDNNVPTPYGQRVCPIPPSQMYKKENLATEASHLLMQCRSVLQFFFLFYFNFTFEIKSFCLLTAYKESILVLKPRADVTRSTKRKYQWPHRKYLCLPKLKKKHFQLNETSHFEKKTFFR